MGCYDGRQSVDAEEAQTGKKSCPFRIQQSGDQRCMECILLSLRTQSNFCVEKRTKNLIPPTKKLLESVFKGLI